LIHPNQVQICNEVFSPSGNELEHAIRLVHAFDSAQAEGKGVAVLDNKLVEHLHYLQAKDLIHRSESISASERI
jgi:citrate lyase beta subunit